MDSNLTILTDDFTDDGEKEYGALSIEKVARLTGVSGETIAANVASAMETLGKALATIPERYGDFELEELQVALSVNGKGVVSLIGRLETGATASLTLKLVRRRGTEGE